MSFAELDRAALARALAPLAERSDDLVDAFLERGEIVELAAEGQGPGIRLWRQEGLAVRLCRDERTWLASRDRIDGDTLADAMRQVARVHPRATPPPLALPERPWGPLPPSEELENFPRLLDRSLRDRRVAFAYRLGLRRHSRDLLVATPRLAPAAERETFYSYEVELPWGRHGGLLLELGPTAAETVAGHLADAFRARDAPPPPAGTTSLVLGSGATVVLLHEAIAHALEADTLLAGRRPEELHGTRLAELPFDVLDDPGGAPAAVRRRSDDEGTAVLPRWLVRRGVIDQALADRRWAQRLPGLEPGAARREGRHHLPVPRSTFLRLLPDAGSLEELVERAAEGLYLPEAERGRLDVGDGSFTLLFPHGRLIRHGALREPVGPCRIRGRVPQLLAGLEAVGGTAAIAGAGWCAKGGQRLPVWGAAAEVLLRHVEVVP